MNETKHKVGLDSLILLSQKFSDLIIDVHAMNETLCKDNQCIRLLVNDMNSAQRRIHQAIGTATMEGILVRD